MPEYTTFTPWLTAGSHRIRLVVLAGIDYHGIRFNQVGLHTVDSPDPTGWSGGWGWNVDSDGDGISDFDEINLHGTDPLNADTDDDGLRTAAELATGTDPLDADSDNDGVVSTAWKSMKP